MGGEEVHEFDGVPLTLESRWLDFFCLMMLEYSNPANKRDPNLKGCLCVVDAGTRHQHVCQQTAGIATEQTRVYLLRT